MKLVTINPQKSTTMGGVETLIRSLHGLFQCENYELYEHAPSNEHYPESAHINYIQYGQQGKLASKLNQISSVRKLQLSAQDVVILFHPNDLLYLPSEVQKRAKIVLVQTNKFSVFFKPFSKLIMTLLHRKIDVFTVYTEQDKHALSSLFPKLSRKIKVIPRGCKLDTAMTHKQVSKKLVTIARIDEGQKNFSAMMEVMTRLPADYQLDIYGDGSEQELSALKQRVNQLNNVTFQGATSDVAATLKDYSVFLMTSRYEGFGQTLIEARSQGLPIVAYHTFDALSWIVEEGVNGYKVADGDSDQFAQRIVQLCENEQLYSLLSAKALDKAQETESSVVDRLWQEAVA
ncbi:glycosyltransferase [Vibrio sp. LaRot3]|uniref:glycosyltransferase n=1 Tax=Vibrio sp. LaRot3 TaxID=2998829 RepID=UPI0022CE040C|nr:glycosyltransferase [Vibrio sp. LaRot3]MDA0148907.1 glycosyltransferase [Vibrio sp. LaRot3]